MIRSLQILSLLLSYPTQEIAEAAGSFDEVLAGEGLLPKPELKKLAVLNAEIADGEIYDNQERYIMLFDRSRSLSLHLFEHVHGESRDRGQAMVDLMSVYESHGLDISAKQLPDYLPLFLEFLATLSLEEARDMLNDPLHIFAALKERLRKRDSIYAAVFQAIEVIAGSTVNAADVEALLQEPEDDPNDLEALDKIWEEEAVSFGPGPGSNAAASCGPDRLGAQIRAGMRPPPEVNSHTGE